jgi:GDP/UDP-N,N'-diacetylbacillosamine 2-epimerase (hydrolysing)
MADTITEFSKIWEQTNYDLVFVLGDRYEMFAAASSTIPFNIPLAHIHGGETTLGAIDDKFRHAITAMSKYHFTSNEKHKQRVIDIVGSSENVYNVGALALEFIDELNIIPTHSNNTIICIIIR